MLLLSVMTIASAQKMTIKTASGHVVEINCDGMQPAEIQVEGDKVTLKMNKAEAEAVAPVEAKVADAPQAETPVAENAESTQAEVTEAAEVPQAEVAENLDKSDAPADSLDENITLGTIANAIVEEYSPEYAAFNKEHANDTVPDKGELVKNVATQLVGKDAVETVDFFGSLFKNMRFTKDSTFVPTYEKRKPRPLWRTYDIIELSGNLGKDIRDATADAVAEEISEADYGDDAQNENQYGGGFKYSHVYIKGKLDENGIWHPNPLGFAWSWGGLIAYSYEKDMGSSFSAMGKIGVQIGTDIAIGVDALMGCGITPYGLFLTDGIHHTYVKRSAFCLKYGIQLWGSLNFSKDTYTAFFGRFIYSQRPNSSASNDGNHPDWNNWELAFEDFDPSSWTVGLAVGYKFGSPEVLSEDKRLQFSTNVGYNFVGEKGMTLSTELEHLTQVSRSTTLSYGLAVEELFSNNENKDKFTSVMLSSGFKVSQPFNKWFWGAKLYAGVGDYTVKFSGQKDEDDGEDEIVESSFKKLSVKTALQLNAGYKLGKNSEIFGGINFGYHFGKAMETEGYYKAEFEWLNGFDLGTRLGYKHTF